MYDGVFTLVFVAAVDSEVVVDSGPEQMRLLKLLAWSVGTKREGSTPGLRERKGP